MLQRWQLQEAQQIGSELLPLLVVGVLPRELQNGVQVGGVVVLVRLLLVVAPEHARKVPQKQRREHVDVHADHQQHVHGAQHRRPEGVPQQGPYDFLPFGAALSRQQRLPARLRVLRRQHVLSDDEEEGEHDDAGEQPRRVAAVPYDVARGMVQKAVGELGALQPTVVRHDALAPQAFRSESP